MLVCLSMLHIELCLFTHYCLHIKEMPKVHLKKLEDCKYSTTIYTKEVTCDAKPIISLNVDSSLVVQNLGCHSKKFKFVEEQFFLENFDPCFMLTKPMRMMILLANMIK